MSKRPDLIGQKFERLTIIKRLGSDRHRNATWLCLCDCGNKIETTTGRLRSGQVKHCCNTCPLTPRMKKAKRHCNHPLYTTWSGIKYRCSNPNNSAYKNYGGRGISICKEWKNSFPTFRDWAEQNGWAPNGKLQIGRIDNNGNYKPSNCRWVTPRENILNQRTKKNNTSGYRGVSLFKHNKLWRAYITIKGKTTHLGYYATPEEAVTARNAYITDHNLQDEYKLQDIIGAVPS